MPVKKRKVIKLRGEDTEIFPIGAFAKALNRKPHTIRVWEMKGIIPKTWIRDKNNDRMYTQEMIDIVVSLAEKYNIHRGITITDFSIEVHQEWNKLKDKYFKKGDS